MIDWARIETLKDDIGGDGVAEVVSMFCEEIEAHLAARKGQPLTAASAHFVKGSALNVGMMHLAELALQAEKSLKADGRCGVTVSDLEREYALGVAALNRRIG